MMDANSAIRVHTHLRDMCRPRIYNFVKGIDFAEYSAEITADKCVLRNGGHIYHIMRDLVVFMQLINTSKVIPREFLVLYAGSKNVCFADDLHIDGQKMFRVHGGNIAIMLFDRYATHSLNNDDIGVIIEMHKKYASLDIFGGLFRIVTDKNRILPALCATNNVCLIFADYYTMGNIRVYIDGKTVCYTDRDCVKYVELGEHETRIVRSYGRKYYELLVYDHIPICHVRKNGVYRPKARRVNTQLVAKIFGVMCLPRCVTHCEFSETLFF